MPASIDKVRRASGVGRIGETPHAPRLTLHALYRRLYRYYGPQHWWPAETPWEMMVGAILTQNTSWTNVETAIAALKRARSLSIKAIAMMPRRRLQKFIRSSGYFRQKAKRLQMFANELRKDPALFRVLSGGIALPPLWGKAGMGGRRDKLQPPTSVLPHPAIEASAGPPRSSGGEGGGRSVELRERLLSLHGIGPETADSILLYATHQPVFVVDAYTRRIGQRMGFLKTNDYNQIQDYFQSALHPSPPPSPLCEGRGRAHRRAGEGEGSRHFVKLYNEFHALLVRHAKECCTNKNPKCEGCPVFVDCAYAFKTSSRRKPGTST